MKAIVITMLLMLIAGAGMSQLIFTGADWDSTVIEIYSCGVVEDLSIYSIQDANGLFLNFERDNVEAGTFIQLDYTEVYSSPLRICVLTGDGLIDVDRIGLNGNGGWAYRINGPEPTLGDFNLDNWYWSDVDVFPTESFPGCDIATATDVVIFGKIKSLYR